MNYDPQADDHARYARYRSQSLEIEANSYSEKWALSAWNYIQQIEAIE